MRYRITFLVGLAIGYVLGARAGRRRYEQIAETTRRVVESEAARKAASRVGDGLTVARERVSERLPVTSVRDFLYRPTPEEEQEVRNQSHPNGTVPRQG